MNALLCVTLPLVTMKRPSARHGAAYALVGIATDRRFGRKFLAVLKWQGAGIFGLTIFGAPFECALPTIIIPGHENFVATRIKPCDWCSVAEVSEGYQGVDDATDGRIFEVHGLTYEVCAEGPAEGERRLELEGQFMGLFDLHFAGSGWL